MREATQGSKGKSSDRLWETLEQMVRGKVREFLQEILEDEVTEFLGGRAKSQRKATVEGEPRGYRNGYGKPRNLTLSGGTVQVRRPRVRDVEERFESLVLPLFARRTKEAGELVLQLYLHGLAEGDFELALRGLLGEGTPLSRSTVRRLRQKWVAEHAEWEKRSLEGREIVYAWADGIYVKAGLEKDKAALLVVIGAMADGTKEVLAVRPGFRESAESWAAVLRGLKARGLGVPKLLVADGNLGIWAAARQVWPEAAEQRCWNHKIVNVLDRLPKREQEAAKRLLRKIAYALRWPRPKRPVKPLGTATAIRIPRRSRSWRATGTGWARSSTSPPGTGGTCGRRTWSRARLRRCGCAPPPPSGSRRSTAPRR